MIVNPFTYGNPITDARRFVGREAHVAQIFSRLRNVEFESSSVVGERRIGKTSLLYYLADAKVRRAHGLASEQFIFVYTDLALLDATTTPARLWHYLLRQMLLNLSDGDAEPLRAALSEPNALDNFTLAEIFDGLDARGRHVVLLLDEFENVTRNENFSPDFFYALRSLAIHHNLALITSSRRELIELTHSDEIRSSPFFNIFANIAVRLLTPDDAHGLIENALSESGVRFTHTETEAVLRFAGTHPFFIQTACHFLFEAYMHELTPAARHEYWTGKFRAEAAPHLSEYWRHCEGREKVVLAALAMLEPHAAAAHARSEFSTSALQNLVGRSERILAQLDKRALVAVRGDSFAPFNGLFTDWILDAVEDEQAEVVTDADGRSFSLADALKSNLHSPVSGIESFGLSPREVEVLQLVATGLSDAQVAAKLVVSPRTVSTHLQSIYGKLGVNSRAAATRFAVENHLV